MGKLTGQEIADMIAAARAKGYERCTIEALGLTLTAEGLGLDKSEAAQVAKLEAEVREKLEKHLSHFIVPVPGSVCPGCDNRWFTWHPITHGETVCTRCNWPGMTHHYIKVDVRGEEFTIKLLNLGLVMHPDSLVHPDDPVEPEVADV